MKMSELNLKFGGKREFVISDSDCRSANVASCVNSRPVRKRKRRHVPHSQRSAEFVEKRNGRERKRVDDLNGAFESLKDRVPFIPRRNVRTSKMKILTNAISYIQHLTTLLTDGGTLSDCYSPASVSDSSLSGQEDTPSLSPSSLVSWTEVELLEDRIPPILADCLAARKSSLPDRTSSLPDKANSLPERMTDAHVPASMECLQDGTSGSPYSVDISPNRRDSLRCTTESSQNEIFSLSKRRKLAFSNALLTTDVGTYPPKTDEFYSNNSSSAHQTIYPNTITGIYPSDPNMQYYDCDPLLAALSLMGHDLIDGSEQRLDTT